jgi:hypothetical protein
MAKPVKMIELMAHIRRFVHGGVMQAEKKLAV